MKNSCNQARAKNGKNHCFLKTENFVLFATVVPNRFKEPFFLQVFNQTWAINGVRFCADSQIRTQNFFPFSPANMSFRQYITIFLLILSLCVLPGCIQTFGTVAEPSVEPNNASLEGKQSGIVFYDNFNEARSVAIQERKPMILFFYSLNCIFSQQMLEETLNDENVTRLSQQFVCVKIDESRQRKMCEEYDVKGTPTIQFINPQGILLQRLKAKKSPGELLPQMQIALESIAAREQYRL